MNRTTEDVFPRGRVIRCVPDAYAGGRERSVRFISKMQDHQRCDELATESVASRHLDTNRVRVFVYVELDGIAYETEISDELANARADCVGCHHQVIDERIGAERRDAREFHREVWRESLVLGGGHNPPKVFAWHSSVRIIS